MDRKALVGLLSGVALVVATLIAVGLLNVPETAIAARSPTACVVGKKPVERGYGLGVPDSSCRDHPLTPSASGRSMALI